MHISKSTLRQTIACTPVLFNSFLTGLGWGWIAPTILYLQQADSVLPITDEEASWVGSINEMGRISSSFILPFIMDHMGRKYYVIFTALLFLASWTCQIFVRDVVLLCLARLIFGVSCGIHDVISSIYTTENCSTFLHDIIGSSTIVLFFAGYFLQLCLATYLAYETVAIISTAVALSTVGTMYFCVETPFLLTIKEKFYKAEKNLVWLRGEISPSHLSHMLENLKFSALEKNREKASIKMLFTSKANYKSLCTILVLYMSISATGFSAIMPYSSLIFSSSHTLTSNNFSMLYGGTIFLSVCTAPLIIKLTSRRKLIITTFMIHVFSNLSMFLLLHMRSTGTNTEILSWLIFVSTVIYGSARAVQFSTIFVIRGELLPPSIRATGGSLAVAMNAASGFAVSKIFLPLSQNYGMEINFLMYASVSMFMIIFTYFALPETKGKLLEEIQRSLEGQKPTSNHDRSFRNPNVVNYKTGNNKFTLTQK